MAFPGLENGILKFQDFPRFTITMGILCISIKSSSTWGSHIRATNINRCPERGCSQLVLHTWDQMCHQEPQTNFNMCCNVLSQHWAPTNLMHLTASHRQCFMSSYLWLFHSLAPGTSPSGSPGTAGYALRLCGPFCQSTICRRRKSQTVQWDLHCNLLKPGAGS